MTNNKQETKKRVKLSLPSIKAMFDLSVAEFETAKNMLAVGDTLGKVKTYFEKQRKTEKQEKERNEKKAREREEIAKQATEKAKQAKALFDKLVNCEPFKDFNTIHLTITNKSQQTSYRDKTWRVYGIREIQGEKYLITDEYEKPNEKGEILYDMPCNIPLSDIYIDYTRLIIKSYERSKKGGYNILHMEYEEITKTK